MYINFVFGVQLFSIGHGSSRGATLPTFYAVVNACPGNDCNYEAQSLT